MGRKVVENVERRRSSRLTKIKHANDNFEHANKNEKVEKEKTETSTKLVRGRKKLIESPKPNGPKLKGSNPNGPNPSGPNPQGPNANGPNPQGPNANGPNPQGPNANGPNPQGPNANGPNPQGPNANGPNPQGPNANGPNPQGPNANGPNPQGPNANGPNPQGPNPQGPNPNGLKSGRKKRSAPVDVKVKHDAVSVSPPKSAKIGPKERVLSSDESDWEEVEEPQQPTTSGPLQVTIHKPKSKQEQYMATELRRAVNRYRQGISLNIHKAHLLCYISHGILLSAACSDSLVKSIALSLVPPGFICTTELATGAKQLTKLLKWFNSAFQTPKQHSTLVASLSILVTILRAVGFSARLVMSVHPNPIVQPSRIVKGSEGTKEEESCSSKKVKTEPETSKTPDYWVELYIEEEEKWIPLDVAMCAVDKTSDIEKSCHKPVIYVLAFDNDNCIRDVTGRYSSDFLTPKIRRLRQASDWLKDVLKRFPGKHRLRNRIEDRQIHDHLLSLPLPTVIAEFKCHPLYVLERDLLKFEAIYPKNTKPVGQVRGEKVYPREAVHTLHCKESWIKDARSIKKGEEPYKVVKARPKMGVPKEEQVVRPLPLFGFWQTEQYVPLPVVNGKIPRNEYGNVELFQPCMLPPGSVHIQVPGLLSVAKNLEIDCAPAMVGWEFHCHRSVPMLDGWIVPKSQSKKLLKEWEKAQVLETERREERRSKKAIQNWKKLIKGLLIRQAVHKKFKIKPGHKEMKGAHAQKDGTLGGPDGSAPAEDVATAWPQNRAKFTL